ncbi:hypothetical protein [Rubritalea marina]|uniref:hypothetical protein n=1 Tax=Rubritalea marina TaxID=361055 RepID=UPI000375AA3F|nr:hypothetical protein [Rubritalea marina]
MRLHPTFYAWICIFILHIPAHSNDQVLMGDASRVSKEEVLQRPLHRLPDLAAMDLAELRAFFAVVPKAGKDCASFVTVPSMDLAEPVKDLVLEYIDLNRSGAHQKQYQMAIDDTLDVPRSGYLIFEERGETPLWSHRESWWISLDDAALYYFSESIPHKHTEVAPEAPVLRFAVLDLAEEVRDQLASMVWYLSQVRSEPVGEVVGEAGTEFGVYDAQAQLTLVDREEFQVIYQAERWLEMAHPIQERWQFDYSPALSASLASEYLHVHGGRVLREQAGMEPIQLMGWSSAMGSDELLPQASAAREKAFVRLLGLLRNGSAPDGFLYTAARLVGETGFDQWREELGQMLKDRLSDRDGKGRVQIAEEELLRAGRTIELSAGKVHATGLAELAVEGLEFSTWAVMQINALEAGEQAVALKHAWEMADVLDRGWVFQWIAGLDPSLAKQMYASLDNEEKLPLAAFYYTKLVMPPALKEPSVSVLMEKVLLSTELLPDVKIAAIAACSNAMYVGAHPTFYEVLERVMESADRELVLGGSAVYRAALIAAMEYPQFTEKLPDMLADLEHVGLEVDDEMEVLSAFLDFAIHRDASIRSEVSAYCERRLLNAPGMVERRIELLIQYEYFELISILERMATRDQEESQSVLARMGLMAQSYPVGRYSYHSARYARCLAADLPCAARSRVWAAMALEHPVLFFDEGVTELGESLLKLIDADVPERSALIDAMRQEGCPRLRALVQLE